METSSFGFTFSFHGYYTGFVSKWLQLFAVTTLYTYNCLQLLVFA